MCCRQRVGHHGDYYVAHFEAKQWKPVEPPFKFPSEEKLMDDHYQGPEDDKFDDHDDDIFYGNLFHTEEHTKPPPHVEQPPHFKPPPPHVEQPPHIKPPPPHAKPPPHTEL